MTDYRQSVREFKRASELLLQVEDLTDHEMQLVDEMLGRISKQLFDGRDLSDSDGEI